MRVVLSFENNEQLEASHVANTIVETNANGMWQGFMQTCMHKIKFNQTKASQSTIFWPLKYLTFTIMTNDEIL